jgi:hypothetical protein
LDLGVGELVIILKDATAKKAQKSRFCLKLDFLAMGHPRKSQPKR